MFQLGSDGGKEEIDQVMIMKNVKRKVAMPLLLANVGISLVRSTREYGHIFIAAKTKQQVKFLRMCFVHTDKIKGKTRH